MAQKKDDPKKTPKGGAHAAAGALSPQETKKKGKGKEAAPHSAVRFGIRLKFSLAIISLVAVVIASISAYFIKRETDILYEQNISFLKREMDHLYNTASPSIGIDDLAIGAAIDDLKNISIHQKVYTWERLFSLVTGKAPARSNQLKRSKGGKADGVDSATPQAGPGSIIFLKYAFVLNANDEIMAFFDYRGNRNINTKLDDGIERRLAARKAVVDSSNDLFMLEIPVPGGKVYDFSRTVLGKAVERKVGTVIIGLSDEVIKSEIRDAIVTIVFIAMGILVISIIGAIVLTTITIRPVRELSRGAAIIGRGNLDHRIAISSSDELGQLAREFNQMTAEIKNARDREIESRILEEQMEMAKEIQEGLNPMGFYNRNGIQLKGHTRAAKGVGGDYFDYIQIDENRIGALISDVSGKGVPASLVMVMIRTVFTTLIKDKDNDCAKIVTAINNALSADFAIDKFATLFFMIYDRSKHELSFSNAGHGPLVCWRASKNAVGTYKLDGVPIGIAEMEENETYLQARVPMGPGDLVMLYTDGVTEMRNEQQDEFTFARVQRFMIENRELDADKFVQKLVDELEEFRGTEPPHDDTTMLVFKCVD